jgi:hypothetical protein
MTKIERIRQVRESLPRLPQMTCFYATYYYSIPANNRTPSSAFQDSFDEPNSKIQSIKGPVKSLVSIELHNRPLKSSVPVPGIPAWGATR